MTEPTETETIYEVWDRTLDIVVLATTNFDEAEAKGEWHKQDGNHGSLVSNRDGHTRLLDLW